MAGSVLVAIVTPIAAVIALGFWLGMIFWAGGHPGWKTHHPPQETQFPGESRTLSGDLHAEEPAPPQQETKAA